MGRQACLVAAALVAGVLAWPPPAGGVIKVDLPVAKIYSSATAVMIGTVAGPPAGNRAVEVKVVETLKGAGVGALRIQFAAPGEAAKGIGPRQTVVVIVGASGGRGRRRALVHASDEWLLAEPIASAGGPAWRTVGRFDGGKSFPGRTAALAEVLRQIKAGRQPIRDAVSHEAFTDGRAKLLARVAIRPSYLVAADLDGDGEPDAVVGAADGSVRLLRLGHDGPAVDVTDAWGLGAARGRLAAAGDADGDGKADLLLGRTLWLRRGGKFTPAAVQPELPVEGDWLAAALADATGDSRADAAVLLRTGKLTVAANPGALGRPWPAAHRALWRPPEEGQAAAFSADWGDDGGVHVMVVGRSDITRYAVGPSAAPPATFRRLTGVGLDACNDVGPMPLKVLVAAAFNYDGLGGADFAVITQAGGVTLSNRGYGCFLINGFLHKAFHSTPAKPIRWTKPFPFRLTETAAVAAGRVLKSARRRRQNLLLVTRDGRLYELDNSR